MRVVWRDNNGKPCPPAKYRDVTITRYNDGFIQGWILDVPNDDNIYVSQDCAKNAIDKILGGTARRNVEQRLKKGIRTVGTYKRVN